MNLDLVLRKGSLWVLTVGEGQVTAFYPAVILLSFWYLCGRRCQVGRVLPLRLGHRSWGPAAFTVLWRSLLDMAGMLTEMIALERWPWSTAFRAPYTTYGALMCNPLVAGKLFLGCFL